MSAPPRHWEGTQLRSSLHYQTQLPSVNNSHVGEGFSLLHVEAQVGVCHCLSRHIIETRNSKDMSNYLAMCKYRIKLLTESTHFGSNLDEIPEYRIGIGNSRPSQTRRATTLTPASSLNWMRCPSVGGGPTSISRKLAAERALGTN